MNEAAENGSELERIFDARAREELIGLAHAVVEAAVKGTPAPLAEVGAIPEDPIFGAFVTLRRRGRLRGCMGTLFRNRSAPDLVSDAARSAALNDPRFSPVEPGELSGLSLEVSLLTPLEELPPDALPVAVRPGVDGLVVESGPCRGLLLPQVATEQDWDALRFLEQTCVKAGLPKDAWSSGAKVSRFAALVLGEDSMAREAADLPDRPKRG